jgi:hypothetical protein
MFFLIGFDYMDVEFEKLPEADTWMDDDFIMKIERYQTDYPEHLPNLKLNWILGDPVYEAWGFYLRPESDEEVLTMEKIDFLLDFGNITSWFDSLGLTGWKVYIGDD